MSILAEENINPSVQIGEQLLNDSFDIKPLLVDIETIIDHKIGQFFKETLRGQIQRINDLEDEVTELKEIIGQQNHTLKTLGLNAVGVSEIPSIDNTKSINELRAEKVFSELVKAQKLNSSAVLHICKLNTKDHRTAHRIMDLAEKMFPEQCKHDTSTVTGKKKHWLSLIDYKGL